MSSFEKQNNILINKDTKEYDLFLERRKFFQICEQFEQDKIKIFNKLLELSEEIKILKEKVQRNN